MAYTKTVLDLWDTTDGEEEVVMEERQDNTPRVLEL